MLGKKQLQRERNKAGNSTGSTTGWVGPQGGDRGLPCLKAGYWWDARARMLGTTSISSSEGLEKLTVSSGSLRSTSRAGGKEREEEEDASGSSRAGSHPKPVTTGELFAIRVPTTSSPASPKSLPCVPGAVEPEGSSAPNNRREEGVEGGGRVRPTQHRASPHTTGPQGHHHHPPPPPPLPAGSTSLLQEEGKETR